MPKDNAGSESVTKFIHKMCIERKGDDHPRSIAKI
jgi:hypothetical protein